MDRRLYESSRSGNVRALTDLLTENPQALDQVTPRGNTALHLAAKGGHVALVSELLRRAPWILERCNSNLDSALHEAARSGHADVVDALLSRDAASAPPRGVASDHPAKIDLELRRLESGGIWKGKNSEKNTALHEAARGGHYAAVNILLKHDEELACELNQAGESPLFKACEAGHVDIVRKLLSVAPSIHDTRNDRRTLLHAAVVGGHLDVAAVLLKERPALAKRADEFGNTPLHLAASKVHLHKMVISLLEADSSMCYGVNRAKKCPLHVAAENGNVKIVQELVRWRPDCVEMLDKDGKTVLHSAVENDEYDVVKWLLRKTHVSEFVNAPDGEGNTALHLATLKDSVQIVKFLLSMPTLNQNVTNKAGLTALDITQVKGGHSFTQVSIWRALVAAGCVHGERTSEIQVQSEISSVINGSIDESYKSMANTVSLVAALIATVTFAAAFTVPGGTIEDGKERGLAVMIDQLAFKVFVVSDTVAMCSSMIVALILIWAVPGVPGMLCGAVGWSLRILWVALVGMVVTFVTAIYLVVAPKSLWLAVSVCVMGSTTPFIVSPLVMLSAKHNARGAHFH